MRIRQFAFLSAAVLPLGVAPVAMAQDAGQILRDVQRNIPHPPPPTPPTPDLAPYTPDEEFLKAGQTMRVNGFRIIAASIPEAELRAQLTDYIGSDCTLGDLKEAAARISRYYAKRDMLARAVLPRQSLEGGMVTIQVLEARMGRVRIDPSSRTRLDPKRARSFIHSQNVPGEPLHPSAVATGISNLGSIPGMQVQGMLSGGAQDGATDVVLKLRDPPLFSTTAVIDNNTAREIGRIRALGIATLSNATGQGDQIVVAGQGTKSSRYGQVTAGAPLFDDGFWLEGTGGALTYDIPKKVNAGEPSGNAQIAALNLRWLSLRTSDAPVSLAVGVEHKWTKDRMSGLVTASNRLAALTFSAHRVMRDGWMGGGAFILDASVKTGNVDLSANKANKALDKTKARTRGKYGKITLTATRRQDLWINGDAAVTLSGQLATKNLNSAEQFALGGLTGTRAYPVNAGSGDQGAMLNLEVAHRPREDLRVSVFWDGGVVEQHKRPWAGWEGAGSPHNTYFQQGAGASVQWNPIDNVRLEATAAKRIGPDAGRRLDIQTAEARRAEMRAWVQLVMAV